MSNAPTPVKRHNHRVHPCTAANKAAQLNALIAEFAEQSILVVADDADALRATLSNENVTVHTDESLAAEPDLRCDLLISYDLPAETAHYFERIGRAKSHARILLDEAGQKRLYPIERALGRTLLQEPLKGFEPAVAEPEKAHRKAYRDDRRDERKPSHDKRPPRKPRSDRDDTSGKTEKGNKKPSKYLGKDENGKPIFSGKSGERNHRYDGTPKSDSEKSAGRPGKKRGPGKPAAAKKPVRKISVKSLKKPAEEK